MAGMNQPMRSRIKEHRRRKLKRTLRLLLISGLVIFGSYSLWKYVHSPGFAFGHASIRGTNLITEADIIKMAGSEPPFNYFQISASKVENALNNDIRFKKASASYRGMAELQVMVEESEPAMYVANSYHSYLKVDFSGLVLNVTKGIPDGKAPVLVGVTCGNVFIGDRITNEQALNVLKFYKGISAEARERVSEIDIDANQCVKLQMTNGFPIILGKLEEPEKKAELFVTVFEEIKGKNINAEYIDLTFAKPYIKLVAVKANEVVVK